MSKRSRGQRGQGASAAAALTELDRAMLAEARRTVTVREGGETREMTARDVAMKRLLEMVIKGSPHAARIWFHLDAEALAREAEVKAEAAASWRDYQERARQLIAAAEKQGKPPPEIIPHPDDIVIDGANSVTFEGAVCVEEALVYNRIAEQREAFMRQHVLDARRARARGEVRPGMQPTSAYLLAAMANTALPKRLQLDEQGMVALHYRFHTQTQRQLLKDSYRARKYLGFPAPRGGTLPGPEALQSALPALAAIAGDVSASAGTDRDVDEALARFASVISAVLAQ